ncbi:ATPase [Stutzerimonas tarimensis]|uniref:ATPase n=1 Tax=Stutzerimonas tarimensis TaxID=1507735 RepID=A0ABV7T6K3_9GAMM
MKIERFEDLIDWTRHTHGRLSTCLSRAAGKHEQLRAQWLLTYLADHEKALARTIGRMEQHAKPHVLRTCIYDYLIREPILFSGPSAKAYDSMSVDDISREVFDIHNQVIELYRSLARRAEIEGARVLADDLLKLEEHETMRLATQVGRINEI